MLVLLRKTTSLVVKCEVEKNKFSDMQAFKKQSKKEDKTIGR